MSEVLRARGIEKVWANRPVLRGADLSVQSGERVGLVGVNGSGKSTLVRIVAGAEPPDAGVVEVRGTLGYMDQDPELPGPTVGHAADDAVRWHRDLHDAWQAALHDGDLAKAATLQSRLDEVGWEVAHRVDAMLSKLGAPPREALVEKLSGGERRRVALARALLGNPDVLLLDEPTNHLDADTVEWLQGFLVGYRGALVLVTHDRYLLEAVATRIVEVEDGVCVSYDGSYGDYLISRAERRATLERQDEARLAMIAREAAWAAKSPAAQTTKQKARLDRLAALQAARPLAKETAVSLDLRTGLKHGSTVLEMRKVKKTVGGRVLMKDLDLALRAGDRLGILGPNGAGKTTLLRMVTGEVQPDAGEIDRGARVRVAVLDQERTGLPLDVTVFEAAGGGNDQVRVGDRWIHVASFLNRFLFGKEFHQRRVEVLSGGERARLLLAKLLLQGANLLLLDEPTNDLDLQTLRVLEEALLDYDGVLLVVTHDRAFLDRVCNGVLAFEGEGRVVRYADRRQHLAALAEAQSRGAEARADAKAEARAAEARGKPADARPGATRKLSYKEQKELEALPARIEALETEQAEIAARLGDAGIWRDPSVDASALSRRLTDLPAEIEALYARWSELDALR